MQRKVVICDDNPMTRDACKKAIEKIPDVVVVPINHPNYLRNTLSANRDTVVLLMDLEFPTQPDSTTMDCIGHKFLPDVRKEFPGIKIIVVTHLDAKHAYEVVLECDRLSLQDDWIDIGKGFKEEEIRARVEKYVYPFGAGSKNGLWILHLSDLHFGNSANFKYWGLAEDGRLGEIIVRDLKKRAAGNDFNGVDLIVLSGDLSDKGRDEEFHKCERFLDDVCRECLSPTSILSGRTARERIVVMPGNHDANFDISRARCIFKDANTLKSLYHELKDEADVPPDLQYLKKYMWAPFDQFIRRAGLARPSVDKLWNVEHLFAGAVWSFPEFRGTVKGGVKVDHCGGVKVSQWS